MVSSTPWMLSIKVLLVSTGVVSIAMAMKFSVPLMLNFAFYEVPAIWSFALSWLKPPYLYVLINGIIISIVASSRFYHQLDDSNSQSEPLVRPNNPSPSDLPVELPPVLIQPAFGIIEPPVVVYESEPRVLDGKPVIINGTEMLAADEDGDESDFVISRSSWNPAQRMESMENLTEYALPVAEKPLVASRFGHRKPARAGPEGVRALRVAKPKRHDTLESTWKTITDGRHMPLTRHLRKSDTWENHGRHVNVSSTDPATPEKMHKSETFKDRTNYTNPLGTSPASSSPGSAKLRREASPSQDELNRRVEAFIKKFNEEMRLQRQESLNHYKEMIRRGAR